MAFSVFDSVSLILTFIFLFNKKHDSWTLKRHNSFQDQNNRKVSHSFTVRLLIFKLQRNVWKFNDICVSWSSPKTDLETNFLNLGGACFLEVCSKFSIFKHLTFVFALSRYADVFWKKVWGNMLFWKRWKKKKIVSLKFNGNEKAIQWEKRTLDCVDGNAKKKKRY